MEIKMKLKLNIYTEKNNRKKEKYNKREDSIEENKKRGQNAKTNNKQ